jgi:signal transduction histidine kinase
VCRRVLDLAAERAAARRVRLELEVPPGDEYGEFDEGQIVQVLLNLVLNAIDATPAGGRVRVQATAASEPLVPTPGRHGSFWRLAVRDDGPGIAPEHRAKLFDPFFTTKPEGTGLGLAVSSKIVEEHRGTIHVETQPGGGTAFIVELPRRFEGLTLQARG